MKTLEEIQNEVSKELYKYSFLDLLGQNYYAMALYVCNVSSIRYAEQAIDRCAARAEAYIGFDIDGDTDAVISRESILKVKEELK